MEFLPTYVSIGNLQLHLVNTILAGSFIIYFVLWLTMLTGFKQKANSLIEHYFRIIIVIPFWLLFSLNIGESVFPNYPILLKEYSLKEVEIINNTDKAASFSFYTMDAQSSAWEAVYERDELFSLDNFTIETGETRSVVIPVDTSKHSSILLKYHDFESNLEYGIKLKSNGVPSKIDVADLKDEILIDYAKDYTYQYYKILIFGFGILFLWYHYGNLLRRARRRRFLILGGLLTFYSLFCIFNYCRTIFAKDIIGI